MEKEIYSFLVCLSYAATEMFICLCLTGRRYKAVRYCMIMLLSFLCIFLSAYFKWGETLPGFFLAALAAPSISITAVLALGKSRATPKLFAIGISAQFIYWIADTLSHSLSKFINYPFSEIAYSLITPMLAVVISYFSLFMINKIKRIPIKRNTTLYFSFLNIVINVGVATLGLMQLHYHGVENKTIYAVSIFVFTSMTASSVLSLILSGMYMSAKHTAQIHEGDIKNLIKYSDEIEQAYKGVRNFKHDYENIKLSLLGDTEVDLKYALESIEINLSKIDKLDIVGNLSKIENPPIKALLYSKLIDFINHEADVSLDVVGTAKNFFIDDFDLVRVLGVLLDNAFEEARETDLCRLRVCVISTDNCMTIVVENSCRPNTSIPKNKTGKYHSIKGEGRGTGLLNLSEILKNYPCCSYRMGVREGASEIFFVELILLRG